MKKLNKITRKDVLEELDKRKKMLDSRIKVAYDVFENEDEYIFSVDEWRRSQNKTRNW